MVGKLHFVSNALFGKMGRAGLGRLRARQHQSKGPFSLDADLEYWLHWWLDVFESLEPRELPLEPRQVRPIVLYTDGSEQGDNRVICGVLLSPRCRRLEHYSYTLTKDTISRWITKDTMINQVEASAGIVSLCT